MYCLHCKTKKTTALIQIAESNRKHIEVSYAVWCNRFAHRVASPNSGQCAQYLISLIFTLSSSIHMRYRKQFKLAYFREKTYSIALQKNVHRKCFFFSQYTFLYNRVKVFQKTSCIFHALLHTRKQTPKCIHQTINTLILQRELMHILFQVIYCNLVCLHF